MVLKILTALQETCLLSIILGERLKIIQEFPPGSDSSGQNRVPEAGKGNQVVKAKDNWARESRQLYPAGHNIDKDIAASANRGFMLSGEVYRREGELIRMSMKVRPAAMIDT